MASSLARRIRRVATLPTTYRETVEFVLVKENGEETEKQIVKRTPIRHNSPLTAEERAGLINIIRQQYREKHKEFRAKRKQARKEARASKATYSPLSKPSAKPSAKGAK